MEDIRWEQRFSNYRKALAKLADVVDNKGQDELSELEKEGLIQRFEYTYELAWKTLQDLLKLKGYDNVKGPTDVLRQALKDGYINDSEGWRDLKQDRQLTTHTYDENTANKIVNSIYTSYYPLFGVLEGRLMEVQSGK